MIKPKGRARLQPSVRRLIFTGGWLILCVATLLCGAARPARAGAFDTPIALSDLDGSAYREWVDGAERVVPGSYGPQQVMGTTTTVPGSFELRYGDTANAGRRHLRIGFNSARPVQTIIAQGGGRVSVLKPGATYPGNLDNEADWTPAERLVGASVTTNEVTRYNYAIWVLPPGTTTRAVRFSHLALPSDPAYYGELAGAYVLADRHSNLAPMASILASAKTANAPRVADLYENLYDSWDNAPPLGEFVVSEQNPEWLLFTWPTNVTVRGAAALWCGFSDAQVQAYNGPASTHPREALETDWLTVASRTNVQSYFNSFVYVVPQWFDFASNVTTRALRLRITKATTQAGGATQGGKRIWLGEFLAMQALGTNSLVSSVINSNAFTVPPPIPITFNMAQTGYATVVIEDAAGKRVRNLVSDTPFPAGTNTLLWDGQDESGKVNAQSFGIYDVQGAVVSPGTYRVRGLRHGAIDLRYEFSVNSGGNPPWKSSDSSSQWLADHTPPSDVLFLPSPSNEVMISSFIAEAGDGIAWVDLNGRKVRGKRWLGNFFSAATHLARDVGPNALPGVTAYGGVGWMGSVKIYAVSNVTETLLLSYPVADGLDDSLGGMAVLNGRLFFTLARLNQIVSVNATNGQVLGTTPLANPRGVAFDASSNLLALSTNQLIKFPAGPNGPNLAAPSVLIASGLEDPKRVCLDAAGNIYISDWGTAHQVKKFSAAGALLGTIGLAGVPEAGPYQTNKMTYPMGMTVTSDGHLWVAENSYVPKRISLWNLATGAHVKGLYGPPGYGGGGSIDPADPTKFYYRDDHFFGGMEFQLDWVAGSNRLTNVYHRYDPRINTNKLTLPYVGPQTPIRHQGRLYLTDAFTSNTTGGPNTAGLWIMRNGIARFIAAFGLANIWEPLKRPEFLPFLPPGANLNDSQYSNPTLFVWSDLNDDEQVQTNEVQFVQEFPGEVTVNDQLVWCTARAQAWAPVSYLTNGTPVYDLNARLVRATNYLNLGVYSLSGQVLDVTNGWTVTAGGPMYGFKNGQTQWTYPSRYPSLQGGQLAPLPSKPGELLGATRIVGFPVKTRDSDAGEIFAINGKIGNVYLFTTDGLFLTTLFKDARIAPQWGFPTAVRGQLLNDISLGTEALWTSFTQTPDTNYYLVAGNNHSSIVRVDGLESTARLPTNQFVLTAADVLAAYEYPKLREAARLTSFGRETLKVLLREQAPVLDGSLADWTNVTWATIDARASAAMQVAGGFLYIAFQTGDTYAADNDGGSVPLLFQQGGGFDLVIGTNPDADRARTNPAAGDLRLVVARVNGAPRATLYRPVSPGAATPYEFTSALRTRHFDAVDDVSADVQLAAGPYGEFEFRLPLATLGLVPVAGKFYSGDLGILRAANPAFAVARQRVYWNNKSTDHTSDLAGEAELTPNLWGRFQFDSSQPLPTISNIPDQVTNEDTPAGPIPFVATATRSNAVLTFSLLPANAQLLPQSGATFGGGGSNFTLTLLPATNTFGTSVVTVVAYDGLNYAARSFTLTVNPVPDPPSFAPQPPRVLNAGQTLVLTNVATDPEAPPQIVTLTLLSMPTNATYATNTGVFTWRPGVAQAGTTNLLSVKASDNGVPPLSATQNIALTVNPLGPFGAAATPLAGGVVQIDVTGDAGPDYTVQASTNLTNWTVLLTTNSPPLPFQFLDTNAAAFPFRFYRVLLGP
jgi:hypothetical protein